MSAAPVIFALTLVAVTTVVIVASTRASAACKGKETKYPKIMSMNVNDACIDNYVERHPNESSVVTMMGSECGYFIPGMEQSCQGMPAGDICELTDDGAYTSSFVNNQKCIDSGDCDGCPGLSRCVNGKCACPCIPHATGSSDQSLIWSRNILWDENRVVTTKQSPNCDFANLPDAEGKFPCVRVADNGSQAIVTRTQLEDTQKDALDPLRYLDSVTVPYIFVPEDWLGDDALSSKAYIGDIAYVEKQKFSIGDSGAVYQAPNIFDIPGGGGLYIQPPPDLEYLEIREAMKLSIISYSSWDNQIQNPGGYRQAIQTSIDSPLFGLGKTHSIVWGPVAINISTGYRQDVTDLLTLGGLFDPLFMNKNVATNAMFVTRNSVTSEYHLVIRGSYKSTLVWLYENFVLDKVNATEFLNNKLGNVPDRGYVAKGAVRALMGKNFSIGSPPASGLLDAKPMFGLAGAGTTVLDFLKGKVDENNKLTITGHSMGGQVASLLTMYVEHNKIFPVNSLKRCIPIANPTVGDAVFANYANNVLTNRMWRVVNRRDIAAMAWDRNILMNALSLYQHVGFDITFYTLWTFLMDLAEDYNYRHFGVIKEIPKDYKGNFKLLLVEVGWQHMVPYAMYYGMDPIKVLTLITF